MLLFYYVFSSIIIKSDKNIFTFDFNKELLNFDQKKYLFLPQYGNGRNEGFAIKSKII